MRKPVALAAGIANSGMGALYGPGTEKDIGDVKTRVKPELFTDQDGVGEVARNFIQAANNMAEAAAVVTRTEDVRSGFGEQGERCKACHTWAHRPRRVSPQPLRGSRRPTRGSGL